MINSFREEALKENHILISKNKFKKQLLFLSNFLKQVLKIIKMSLLLNYKEIIQKSLA